jgi:3-hydroxyisobutyrate dehydrogenase-like beta-hydroxyacid dehydrogenase
MTNLTVGLLHPGEMGSALGRALRARGRTVLWASSARSPDTARRAAEAGLEDAGTTDELSRRSDVILSVCPPHAAVAVARSVSDFGGVYIDANAVSPATARAIETMFEHFVDGGIIGPPPVAAGTTRIYLAGQEGRFAAGLFVGSIVEARVVSGRVGDASALKMVYAAWTKGTAALLLAIRAVARAEAVEDALLGEWRASLPDLPDRSIRAERSAEAKGWRWVAEMEEIADTFAAAGEPDGFHRAAAEIFRRA